jgi:hypothetical protein
VTFDLPVSSDHKMNSRRPALDRSDWGATIQTIVDTAATVIPYELVSCPGNAVDQQKLVIDIVTKLCDALSRRRHEEAEMRSAYERKKKHLQKLKQRCQTLMTDVRKGKALLADQLEIVRNDEEGSVAKKVAELEALMASHAAKQRSLVQADSRASSQRIREYSDREAEEILSNIGKTF